MNSVTRLFFRAGLLTTAVGTLVASAVLFIQPFAATADDSTSSSTPATESTTTTQALDQSANESSSTPPALTELFTSPVLTNGESTGDDPIPVVLTFSQDVTGLTASMIQISVAEVQNFTQVSGNVYTFNAVETAPSGSVTIDLNSNLVMDADGVYNQAAPELQFPYSNTLPNNTGGSGTSTPPTVTITSGPADGSTVSTSTVTFDFTTENASSTQCSFGSNAGFYDCGSPQTFSNLVDGVYPFAINVTNGSGQTASTSLSFTVDLEAATSTDGNGSNPGDGTTGGGTTGGGTSGGYSGGFFGGGGSSSGPINGGSSTGGTTGTTVGSSGIVTGGEVGYSYHPGLETGTGGRLAAGTNGTTGFGTNGFDTVTATDTQNTASDTASTTVANQLAAAAASAKTSAAIVWGSIIVVLLLLIGGGVWYARVVARDN